MTTIEHSQEKTPIANRRAFDGSVAVPHVVQESETLSKIAASYHMQRWQPIWIYNTMVEKVLDDDPNSVRKGVTIFVPRSRAGYDKLIRRLKSLSEQMKADGDKLVYELQAQGYSLKANKELLNFTGDVATLGATLALKLGNVCKLAKVAEASRGQAKIAARLVVNGAGQSFAAELKAARTRLVKTALVDHQGLQAARKGVTDFYKGKGIDAASKLADSRLQQATGNDEKTPFKHAKNAFAAGKTLKHGLRHGLSLAALGEVAEIVLDYVEPAGLAEKYLKWQAGETAEGTIDKMIEQVRQSAEANAKAIDLKVEKYQKEAALVYN